MTPTRVDIQAIQQAIRALSRLEREDLAEWISNSPGPEDRVQETALAYGGRHELTVEEYLQLQEESDVRHEYVAGQIFAMSSPLRSMEVTVFRRSCQWSPQVLTPAEVFESRALEVNIGLADIYEGVR